KREEEEKRERKKRKEKREERRKKRRKNAEEEENRDNGVRQLADMVSGAYQNGQYDDGVEFLQGFIRDSENDDDVVDGDIAYAKYRLINSFFSKRMQDAKQDELEEVQDQFMEKLIQFVRAHPRAEQSADAMLQVGLNDEFSGKIDEAEDWYTRIADTFPGSAAARKARGANIRLNSEGRKVPLRGQTIDGNSFDLSSLEGKVVLIQYWATWCEPCKNDLRQIKEAYDRYRRRGFTVVGVSLDRTPDDLRGYLRENNLPWTHLYAEGELDSPLAEQLGVSLVPTMILVDEDGKVVDRNVAAADLDRALNRQYKDDDD
ncbi:MAG: thioredoxin-like domain-containing protein, partial [Pirellulaceae bacterium]